jgi:hypothetical protein
VLFAAASNDPAGGDRTDGECPPEETCSPDTPNGLYFGSEALGDSPLELIVEPHRTAIGGTHTVSVWLDADGNTEFTGFEAKSAGPSFEIAGVASNFVEVHGLAEGTDYLRLVETGTELLYDRINLETSGITRAGIIPGRGQLAGDSELHDAAEPALLYHADTQYNLAMALFDADSVRLIDESVDVNLGTGFARDPERWDRISTPSLAAGTYSFNIVAGDGLTYNAQIDVVDAVDTVTWIAGVGLSTPPDAPLPVGQSRTYCFRASAGGTPVIGGTWTFTSPSLMLSDPLLTNCVSVTAQAPARPEPLTAAIDGVEITVTVNITAQAPAQPDEARARVAPRSTPAAGERLSAPVTSW